VLVGVHLAARLRYGRPDVTKGTAAMVVRRQAVQAQAVERDALKLVALTFFALGHAR